MRPWICGLLLLATGCEDSSSPKDPDETFWGVDLGDPQDWIDPVEYHLAAATTATWLAQIGSAWVADGSHPCAEAQPDSSLILTPGADCPHPLLAGLAGTAILQIPDAQEPTFSADASGLSVGGRPVLAQQFPFVQGAPTGDQMEVAFSTSDYGTETQWTWVIHVSTQGTPELADDALEILGAVTTPETLPDRWKDGDNEVNMAITSLVLDPSCRSNPTGGSVIVERSSYWPLFEVLSHSDCDGRFSIDSTAQEDEWTPALDLLTGQ